MTEQEVVLTSIEQLSQFLRERQSPYMNGDGCIVSVVVELPVSERGAWREDRSCMSSNR